MENSFLNVSHWIVELKTHTYTCSPKVILCGNKVDLTSERKVDSFLVTKQFKDLNLTYVETSAYTGQGIDQAMEAIAKLVLNSKLVLKIFSSWFMRFFNMFAHLYFIFNKDILGF